MTTKTTVPQQTFPTLACFSQATAHLLDVLKALRMSIPSYQAACMCGNLALDAMHVLKLVREAIAFAAEHPSQGKPVTTWTIEAACVDHLELDDLTDFAALAWSYFAGSDELISLACTHANIYAGLDNTAQIRAEMLQIRA